MTSSKSNVLYLPSTPLNILVSAAHAVAFADSQSAEICLIDQKQSRKNIYFQALNNWENSPFVRVNILSGSAAGSAEKLGERRKNLALLDKLLIKNLPDVIAVGSDRRIEFQYAMHRLKQAGNSAQGWYLDDGLYSYSGRKSVWYKDQFNAILKKIIYGAWWREPDSVGTSSWINKAWLFQPDQAIAEIKNKACARLEPEWFKSELLRSFGQQVLDQFDVETETLETRDLIIIVPHPNNILKMKGYEKRVRSFLEVLSQKGLQVGIKYHPRTPATDPLKFASIENVTVIPAALAFEFIIPYVNSSIHIIGDVGTGILTPQWLRPELHVTGVITEDDPFQVSFKPILEKLGVQTVADFNDINLAI